MALFLAGYGNTAGHCAAEKGHAECFNCYVQHHGSLTILNDRNETAVQSGRRFGAPVKLQKAGGCCAGLISLRYTSYAR